MGQGYNPRWGIEQTSDKLVVEQKLHCTDLFPPCIFLSASLFSFSIISPPFEALGITCGCILAGFSFLMAYIFLEFSRVIIDKQSFTIHIENRYPGLTGWKSAKIIPFESIASLPCIGFENYNVPDMGGGGCDFCVFFKMRDNSHVKIIKTTDRNEAYELIERIESFFKQISHLGEK